MMDFFVGMSTLQQSFWWVAIIASFIFLVQLIFTIIGTDFTDDNQIDFFPDLIDDKFTEFEGLKKQIIVNKYQYCPK